MDWNNPYTWVGKDFHCHFHPEGINTHVYKVEGDRVIFGYFVGKRHIFAACTSDEFLRDFEYIEEPTQEATNG